MKRRKVRIIFTIIKYVFSFAAVVGASIVMKAPGYAACGIIELALIFLISNTLVSANRICGIIINDILQFIFNLEFLVLFFGRSFVTTVMIENLSSIQDLGGNAVEYGLGALLLIVISFLPITSLFQPKNAGNAALTTGLFILLVAAEAGMLFTDASQGSAWMNAVRTAQQYANEASFKQLITSQASTTARDPDEKIVLDKTSQFYRSDIDDDISKPDNLPEKPNIVLILTEGLSQNVVDDSRNIMPNMQAFQDECITFDNYYNHTFATFRGIIGQLYSGYQLDNLDINRLASMESILNDNGYHTMMVNVEPLNMEFSGYLDTLGFDEVVTSPDVRNGGAGTISDQDAYRILFDTMMNEPSDTPFFICIYTFGTHESFGSPDEVFGNGTSDELNKFYNVDNAFGKFLDNFKKSRLQKNTILVLTADHCTYADSDFALYFPNHKREHNMIDQVPLMIYYDQVHKKSIDVNGRNSICLAPTLLDLMDIGGENMFLGSSLFSQLHVSSFETCTAITTALFTTKNCEIGKYPAEGYDEINEQIKQYYIEKLK